MQYSANYPRIRFYSMGVSDAAGALVTTKAISWKYEKEWRIIDPKKAGQYVQLSEQTITGIVIGLRTDDRIRNSILHWNSTRRQPLQVQKITEIPGSFDLKLEAY